MNREAFNAEDATWVTKAFEYTCVTLDSMHNGVSPLKVVANMINCIHSLNCMLWMGDVDLVNPCFSHCWDPSRWLSELCWSIVTSLYS